MRIATSRPWWIYCTGPKSLWLCKRSMFPKMNDIYYSKVSVILHCFTVYRSFPFSEAVRNKFRLSREELETMWIWLHTVFLAKRRTLSAKKRQQTVSMITNWLLTLSRSFATNLYPAACETVHTLLLLTTSVCFPRWLGFVTVFWLPYVNRRVSVLHVSFVEKSSSFETYL